MAFSWLLVILLPALAIYTVLLYPTAHVEEILYPYGAQAATAPADEWS